MSSWFGDRIRCAREGLGLTREQLAKAAGCSSGTVQKLEAGRDIYAVSYMGMCRALGLEIIFVEPS